MQWLFWKYVDLYRREIIHDTKGKKHYVLSKAVFPLYRIAFVRQIGFLFTHKTVVVARFLRLGRRCTSPVTIVECHTLDRSFCHSLVSYM